MQASMQSDIQSVVVAIFATVFGEELWEARPLTVDESCVTGIVAFTGACEGALVLRCESSLARWIAQAMFATEHPPQPNEVADAIGEMANIAAGNIRAVLPQPCQIGLPVVALGADYGVSVIGATIRAHADLACAAGQLSVSLLAQSTSAQSPLRSQ